MKRPPLQVIDSHESTILHLPLHPAGGNPGTRRPPVARPASTTAAAKDTLLAVLTALSDAPDSETAVNQVLEITGTAIAADVAELWLVSEDEASAVLSSSWGAADVDTAGLEAAGRRAPCPLGTGLVGAAWATGQGAVMSVAEAELDGDRVRAAAQLRLAQSLAVPVVGGGRALGVLLYFFRSREAPEHSELTEAWPVARHLGAFLFRAREANEARKTIDLMSELAATDPLTGLRNRREFDRAMKSIPRGPFAILSIDMDHLKETNDEYGHEAGDALLRAVAARLALLIRGSDVLARVGGDEFAAILANVDAERTRNVAERFRAAVRSLSVTYGSPQVSIGWATAVEGVDPAAVWRTADECLYSAKGSGGDAIVGAEYTVNDMMTSTRTSFIDLLSVVLVKRTVNTVFQPIVNIHDGSVLGYEALSRPEGYAPTASIDGLFDAARRTGYLAELDGFCRRAAIKRASCLPANSLLFLNVSSGIFLKPAQALAQLLSLLKKAGREPGSTVLEISEREHIRDLERLMAVVDSYRREGLRFAVDDLGEGHTTFELMAASGAEFLKLGRSLTATATRADSTAAIRAAVTYAKATRAQVIAEGIENERARDEVRALGIVFGQGFGLGEPTAAEDIEHVVTGVGLRSRPRSGARRPAG